jgi:O-antigen/teichoic acid export membrane protein
MEDRALDDGVDILDTSDAGPTVIRGGVVRIAGYVAGILLSVISASVVLRYLGPRDSGRYGTVIAIVTVVAGLAEAGTTSIGLREYSTLQGAEREHFMRNLFGLRVALAAVGAVVAIAFSLAAGYDGQMVVGTLLAGLALLLTVTQQSLAIPLQVRLRLGWVSGLELLRQALMTAGLLACALAGAGIVPLLAIQIPIGLVIVAANVPLVRGMMPLGAAFDRAAWRSLGAAVAPFAAATAVGVLYAYVTIVLLSLVSTQTETGYFNAGFRVFVVLTGIPGLLLNSAFPLLARAARDDRVRLSYATRRLYEISFITGTALALGTAIGAPFIIDVVAGNGYGPAVDVLRLQGVALLMTSVLATGGYLLLSLKRYRQLLLANVAGLVVSAVCTLALAPAHGALGGAVGNLAGETVLALGYLLGLRGSDTAAERSFAVLPKVVLAAALGMAASVLPGLPSVVAAILAVAVYGVVLLATRAIPPEVFEALKGFRS